MRFEVPEQDFEAAEPQAALDRGQVIAYLARGGLLSILRSNTSGGRNQPQVWLTLDTRGNATHTFSESRGAVGGVTVPFWVLHGERIFVPKVDDVQRFLENLGLSAGDAAQVIAEVGTAP